MLFTCSGKGTSILGLLGRKVVIQMGGEHYLGPHRPEALAVSEAALRVMFKGLL